MQIVSPTGAALSLAIVGYESDANTGPRPEDDWLVIAGEVRLPGGRAWTFRDPCLRVVEAEALSRWLRQPEEVCRFQDPLLAFEISGDGLRVRFSHESLPPWMRLGHPRGYLGGVLELQIQVGPDPAVVLRSFAAEWDAAVRQFEGRAVVAHRVGEAERLLRTALR